VIKHIRGSIKLSLEEEYTKQAEEDEKYIEQEKAKYQGEDKTKHELNAEMLKIAQVIDRESRMNKMWNEEDEDEDDDEDEMFGSDEDHKNQNDRRGGRNDKK
jgi:hypothetical protein